MVNNINNTFRQLACQQAKRVSNYDSLDFPVIKLVTSIKGLKNTSTY